MTSIPASARGAAPAYAFAFALALSLSGCGGDDDKKAADATTADASAGVDVHGDASADAGPVAGDPAAAAALAALAADASWRLTGLSAEAHVVRTASNVPHIYAANRADLARVMGFVAARDRFFLIDMMRRLGLGTLSEIFGSVALAADAQSRGSGMTAVADRLHAAAKGEMAAIFDGYASGVNDYIAAVAAGKLPPPSELALAAGLLGYDSPAAAMRPFDRRAMTGVLAVVLFQQGYETDDVRRAEHSAAIVMATAGADVPDADKRRDALLADVLGRVDPLYADTTTPGYGRNGGWSAPKSPPGGEGGSGGGGGGGGKELPSQAPRPGALPLPRAGAARALPVPAATLARTRARLDDLSARLGKPERGAYGSNIWTVSGAVAQDGAAILASDGHLELAVPSLFWRVGLDTHVLGGGETHQLGLTFAGLPLLGAGTNGAIAWSNTYLYGDITDYYREELELDANGAPATLRHKGEDKALVAIEERYDTAAIKLLGSAGGEVVRTRYETWDGRRLVGIEGRLATDAEIADPSRLAEGEALVDVLGDVVVPGDSDGDGVIVGISMDLTTLDVADTPGAIDAIGHAKGVDDLVEATRRFVGWAQNMMAVDSQGHALYTSYNATPCRGYLPRDEGGFVAGADPRELLDGTLYRGFEIPQKDGLVDESAAAGDPYRCVIPFDAWPTAKDPAAGSIVNANNDFSGTASDGVLGNDAYYLGGAWVLGLRAHAIAAGIAAAKTAASADGAVVTADEMAAVQGETRSTLGCRLGPVLVATLDKAKVEAQTTKPPSALAAVWLADPATLTIVRDRVQGWVARGCPAASGVATFYAAPSADDVDDSVATTLFNAWLVEALHGVFDDEGVAFDPLEALRAFVLAVEGRGAGNANGLLGFDDARGESVLFDVVGTAAVERSDEVLAAAMLAALARLRAKPSDKGLGGYGTDDVAAWRWGLRHLLRLDSILASFLDGVSSLGALLANFAITPERLPLADDIAKGDPRKGLPGFPRPGDYGAVDAAAPNAIRSAVYGDPAGQAGAPRDMGYSHGPIMRMVIALSPPDATHPHGRVAGRTILPGGQSALLDSPFFHDQLALWLGNDTQPMLFAPTDVLAGAIAHERYLPAP